MDHSRKSFTVYFQSSSAAKYGMTKTLCPRSIFAAEYMIKKAPPFSALILVIHLSAFKSTEAKAKAKLIYTIPPNVRSILIKLPFSGESASFYRR